MGAKEKNLPGKISYAARRKIVIEVANNLIARGHQVQIAVPTLDRYDLLVDNHLKVAIKIAGAWIRLIRRPKKNQPKSKKGYVYNYLHWHFNFHRHNVLFRYADIVICIALFLDGKKGISIIPWNEIGGKTISLIAPIRNALRPKGSKLFSRFQNRWDVFPQPPTSRPHAA